MAAAVVVVVAVVAGRAIQKAPASEMEGDGESAEYMSQLKYFIIFCY